MKSMTNKTTRMISMAMFMTFLIVMLPVCFADSLSLSYDDNGNLVTGDGVYRVYNSLNQLWKVYNNSDTTTLLQEYIYHPIEERVLIKKEYSGGSVKDTTYYVSKDLVRIVNSSGSYDFTYIYHEGQLIAERDNDGNKRYYMPDHLGSTSLITDSSGNAIENTSYAPFGEILSGGDASRYQYEGKEFNPSMNDYDYLARRYSPEFGKFTQPDKIIQNFYDPQTLNRYAFERDNPWKHIDPDGTAFWIPFAIGGVAGLIHGAYHLYKHPGDYKGAALHAGITTTAVTASIFAPVNFAVSGIIRATGSVGGRLFAIGAAESLAHTAVEKGDFRSSSTYLKAGLSGLSNVGTGQMLGKIKVPGIKIYKPGQYAASKSFSSAMYSQFLSNSLITAPTYGLTYSANWLFNYQVSDNADKSSSGVGGSCGSTTGGGRTWESLRDAVENASPGDKAGDVIRRWRGW